MTTSIDPRAQYAAVEAELASLPDSARCSHLVETGRYHGGCLWCELNETLDHLLRWVFLADAVAENRRVRLGTQS